MQEMTVAPGIYKFMDCSTSHITKDDNTLLNVVAEDNGMREGLRESSPVVYYFSEYGFMVNTNHDPKAMLEAGYSEELVALLAHAVKHGCWWLRLDCDGCVFEEFLQFDW